MLHVVSQVLTNTDGAAGLFIDAMINDGVALGTIVAMVLAGLVVTR